MAPCVMTDDDDDDDAHQASVSTVCLTESFYFSPLNVCSINVLISYAGFFLCKILAC